MESRLSKLYSHLKLKIKYYSFFNFRFPKSCVIVPFDSLMGAVGLADRLRHCLSVYLVCKEKGLPFKILHNNPFQLDLILQPNKYDWTIKEDEYSDSIYFTRFIKLGSWYKAHGTSEEEESLQQQNILKNFLKNTRLQYHVYGNSHIYKGQWKDAFNELFKPSDELSEKIKELNLPDKYDAVTLRFQQLLGDFEEGSFKTLSVEDQDKLIQKCIDEIQLLKKNNYFKSDKLLVTSDSVRFLSKVSELPYVMIIPGEMAHPGHGTDKPVSVYMKSFVDLFALRNAKSITLLITGDMYPSGFPEFASCIGEGNFKIHKF